MPPRSTIPSRFSRSASAPALNRPAAKPASRARSSTTGGSIHAPRNIAAERPMPKSTPSHCSLRRRGNAMTKYSRSAAAVKTKNVTEKSQGGLQPIQPTSSGIATAAVASRDLRLASTRLQRRRERAVELFVGAAEAPAPPLEIEQRLQVFALAEVGPQGRGHVELAVGDLPEIEIAQAHLAAGADQKIGIGYSLGIEPRRDECGVDCGGVELSVARLARDPAGQPHDFIAPAIAQREDDSHAPVLARDLDDLFQDRAHLGRQARAVAD